MTRRMRLQGCLYEWSVIAAEFIKTGVLNHTVPDVQERL